MVKSKVTRWSPLPQLILYAGVSLSIGLLIPFLYKWSYRSNVPERERQLLMASFVTLGFTACAFALWRWTALVWPRPASAEGKNTNGQAVPSHGRSQYSLRKMFAITTATATILMLARFYPGLRSGGLLVIAGTAIAAAVFPSGARIRTYTLLSVLYFPQVWIVRFNTPFGRTSGLIEGLYMYPGMFPAVLIVSLCDLRLDHLEKVAPLLVSVALICGVWMAFRGGKLATAYLLFVLIVSSLSSMILHVMYRA